jgi:hypothetical protein
MQGPCFSWANGLDQIDIFFKKLHLQSNFEKYDLQSYIFIDDIQSYFLNISYLSYIKHTSLKIKGHLNITFKVVYLYF